ncbi:hypothetical protein D3C77_62900 [compost metagenome]
MIANWPASGGAPIIEPMDGVIAHMLSSGVFHPAEESSMPWYAWLILILAIGSIVGGLMLLRDTAKKLPLTEEQLKRIHERNAQMDEKDAQDR